MRKEDAIRVLFSVRQAARAFPYERYLFTLFPSFALLLASDKIGASEILLFTLAFAFAMAAGFIYNTVCDAEKDPEAKNPITRGDMSTKRAVRALVLSLFVATALFIWASQSILAIFSFAVYMWIWFAYSGLGARLKESVLGPVAASIVLWSGPPTLLLVSSSYFNISAALLVLGLFSIYTSHEIRHTIIDYDIDVAYDNKTFAVILGQKHASIVAYTALTFGSVFILASAYFPPPSFSVSILLLFALLFIISIASTALYESRRNYHLPGGVRFTTLPYVVTAIFIITFGFTVLRLPLIFAFFASWFYLVSPWSS
jgi:4-hydroxybenzoate polyprenyltransferase